MAISIKYFQFNNFAFLLVLIMVFTSCSQANEDKNIKADLSSKAKTDLNFAAVNFTVDEGVVTLTGKCASEKSKGAAEQTVKNINIVKGIINQIVVAPVTINADFVLKQAVDSVLTSYPSAKAAVNGNTILLEGKAAKKDMDKLLLGLNKLHPDKIENQLKAE
ncbi:MAG: BON domain-containing protein [Janthinobacterium lividum]